MLSDLEKKTLVVCCQSNENITISIKLEGKIFIYKSRFLSLSFKKGFLVIDRPTPDTPDAEPLRKGQIFEGFFAVKNFRYLIDSRIIDYIPFKIGNTEVHAARVRLPAELGDGDKREYFRVQSTMRPPVAVSFNIYEKGSTTPIMENLMENKVKEFRAEMVDISGGGFSMRVKPGVQQLLLDKGDTINAKFKLKADVEELEIWCDVRNKRKYRDTEIIIWGMQFLEGEKNSHLKYCRNKIMHYVVGRQREMLNR